MVAADITEGEWDRIADINLRGAFLCMSTPALRALSRTSLRQGSVSGTTRLTSSAANVFSTVVNHSWASGVNLSPMRCRRSSTAFSTNDILFFISHRSAPSCAFVHCFGLM
jgi:NAD(P)-dependent dehydrogenase (short-subunit alcohol dehydrogenase family)